MKKKYTDEDLLEALRAASEDGMMGPTYHAYLEGPNRPSAEAIRARFGGWTNAVRKAGMIPAARRTKREMKKLVKLGKVDAKYPALRMGMSVRELKVAVGLEKPRKPTRQRYIDEGARIARKLGRAPNFHEFNRYTKTVTAWNPYRLYERDWKAFKRDVEKRLKEKERDKAMKAKKKPKKRKTTKAKAKPKKKVTRAKAKARPKKKVTRAKAKAKPKKKATRAKAKAKPKKKATRAKAKKKATRAKKKAKPKKKATRAKAKAKKKAKPKKKATRAKAKTKKKAKAKSKAKSRKKK